MVKQYINDICHYSQMQVFATSVYQKKFLQFQIDEATEELTDLFLTQQTLGSTLPQETGNNIPNSGDPEPITLPTTPPEVEREFTLEELAKNDGRGTNPAYVAMNGIVYDVSNKVRWAGGSHFGLDAGRDLTEAFLECHRGMYDILEQVPKVGILKKNVT